MSGLFFTRDQFDEIGHFRHSISGLIDFEQHLKETGAAADEHAPWCVCPRCKPGDYFINTCPLCKSSKIRHKHIREE